LSLQLDKLVAPAGLAPAEDPEAPLKRVLVAEDDPFYRHLLERTLTDSGYLVQSVADGLAALERARLAGSPRLLVMDWVMPGLEGPEVCRRLRQFPAGGYQYIILLSANDRKADIIAGLEAGADDYLTKPFDSPELLARMRVGLRMIKLQDNLFIAHERLRFQATHDPLTGISNRGALLDLLRAELDRAQRKAAPVALMMIDIDRFKRVNDELGHQLGDAVLHEVAQRLARTVRSYDVIGRYGGEEFLVGAELDRRQAFEYAERLRNSVISSPVGASGRTLFVSVSIGVAVADPARPCDLTPLIESADAALYSAKNNGRNRVEFAEPAGTVFDMNESAIED
jgi:diguanylate cyclase (GGDEF)-like protein